MSIIGALFGLGTGIAGSIIGNKKQKNAEKRQWNKEVEMFNMQKDFQREMAKRNQNFAKESMATSQEYQKEMNAINFEQQNQMFDKTAEYMSVGSQKQRMKEAGMNPALAYGLTGGGGQSASGGGSGAGAAAGSGSGSVNPTTQAIMMGLQAKGMQSQIRVNQATTAEKIANAAKTNAEKKNIEAERPNIEAQGRSIEAGINLLNQLCGQRFFPTLLTFLWLCVQLPSACLFASLAFSLAICAIHSSSDGKLSLVILGLGTADNLLIFSSNAAILASYCLRLFSRILFLLVRVSTLFCHPLEPLSLSSPKDGSL